MKSTGGWQIRWKLAKETLFSLSKLFKLTLNVKVRNPFQSTEGQDGYTNQLLLKNCKMLPLSDTSALKYKLSESANSKIKYVGYYMETKASSIKFQFSCKIIWKEEKSIYPLCKKYYSPFSNITRSQQCTFNNTLTFSTLSTQLGYPSVCWKLY